MKKRFIHKFKNKFLVIGLIITVFIIILLLGRNIILAEDVFLKYTFSPAGPCINYEFYDTNVEFSSDGTVNIYCNDFDIALSDEYPEDVFQISDDETKLLKAAIMKNHILLLPKNISTDSCDGSFSYLTVYTIFGEFTTGGLNVDKPRFSAVEDVIYELVGSEFGALNKKVHTIQEEEYYKQQ